MINSPVYIIFMLMGIVPWGMFLGTGGITIQVIGLLGIVASYLVDRFGF